MESDVFKKVHRFKGLSFWRRLWNNSPFVTNLAIDLDSISGIHASGTLLSPGEILKLYRDHKILFYKDKRPILLRKGLFSRIRILNINQLTESEKEELVKLLKEKS